MKVNSQKKQI